MASHSEIARWMREQHEKCVELSGSLMERAAAVPRVKLEDWLKELHDEFERYRAHMLKHFALEEEGGYLTSVLEVRPALNSEVQSLVGEHREISQLLTSVMEELTALGPTTPMHILDACGRIRVLLDQIVEHEDHENMLVSHVFSQDMGTKD